MHRFYSDEELIKGSVITITGREAAHITGVLRLRAGKDVSLFDGRGVECRGRVSVEILEVWEGKAESGLEIILGQGIPKADKMESIIRKATELGVSGVVPLFMERTVPRSFNSARLERWRRIALEACKQSQRSEVPHISEPVTLREFMELSGNADLKLIPWEGEKNVSLKDVLPAGTSPKSAFIIIGPEGGLTIEEVNEAARGGFVPVSLGRRILRTETVSPAVLSILQYLYGDI